MYSTVHCFTALPSISIAIGVIDDGSGNKRSDKRRGLAEDVEKGEEDVHLGRRRDFGHERGGICLPGGRSTPVPRLEQPELPYVMESNHVRPVADHSPDVDHDGGNSVEDEHLFGGKLPSLLHPDLD